MSVNEQRAHPRVPLVLSAIMAVGDAWYPAVVTDISAGGTGLQYLESCPLAGMVGQLDITGFGSFDGITVRDGRDFRGFRFLSGEGERNALLAKLVRYIEKGLLDPLCATEPLVSQLSLTRLNGGKQNCEVESISVNGVQLSTHERPPVGEMVRMGHMYGRVVRHTPAGINVRFLSFVSRPSSAEGANQSNGYGTGRQGLG